MTRFEFNSVFVSIILGFAASEILVSWGRLIRHRADVKISGFYVGFSAWVLLGMILHWLGFWTYQSVPFDHAIQSLVILLPPLVIALVSFVLTPEITRGHPFDLEAFYFDVSRWVFPLMGLTWVLALLSDVVLNITDTESPVFYVGPAFLIGSLGFTKNRRVHVVVLTMLWFVLLAFLFFGAM